MSDAPRTITGVFRTPEGVVIANRTLTWYRAPRKTRAQGASVIVDELFRTATDASGNVNVAVVPGNYLVMVNLADADRYFEVGVPEGTGALNMADLVSLSVAPVTPAEVDQARQYRDEARAWARNPEDEEVSGGEYSAFHWAKKSEAQSNHAEEWAQSPDPISPAAGGNGTTDRSAKFWAGQSEAIALPDGAITGPKLADGAVAEPKLARGLLARVGAMFDTVADLLADTTLTYADVSEGEIITAQGFRYEVAGTNAVDWHVETAGGVRLYYKFIGALNVAALGAIGINSSAYSSRNHAAFQKAINILISGGGGSLYIPAGRYRVSDEIDFWRPNSPRVDLEIYGDGPLSTQVLSDFYGAGKALIKSVDPEFTTRSSPISLHGLSLGSVSRSGGVNPVYLDIAGWGESRIESVRFLPSNNTVWRGGGMQNIRGSDVVSYYGGKFYNWKPTAGVTFSLSGQTLTASAPIFTSDDIGLQITLNYTGNRRSFEIATIVDPTTATVASANYRLGDVSDVSGWFEGAVGNMTAGSSLLFTVPGMSTFSPGDVGRTILVQGAREGTNGAGNRAVLRGKIIEYVQPHAVRLGDELGNPIPAQRTVGKARFATPLADFYQPKAPGGSVSLGAGSSDVQIDKIHIEHYFGVAVFCENVGEWTLSGKIHGETIPTDHSISGEAFWLNDVGFEFSGVLDSSCGFSRSRVYVADQNKTARFKNIFNRNRVNDKFLFVEPFLDPGGYVEVDCIEMANYSQTLAGWVSDQNSPTRTLIIGSVNMLGDMAPAETHLGYGVFTNKAGEVTLSRIGDVRIITGIGTPEGSVTAGKGSMYLRIDGAAALSLYIKTVAGGNTGWKAVTTAS